MSASQLTRESLAFSKNAVRRNLSNRCPDDRAGFVLSDHIEIQELWQGSSSGVHGPRPCRKGSYLLKPRVLFLEEKGRYKSYEFEPVTLTVIQPNLRLAQGSRVEKLPARTKEASKPRLEAGFRPAYGNSLGRLLLRQASATGLFAGNVMVPVE